MHREDIFMEVMLYEWRNHEECFDCSRAYCRAVSFCIRRTEDADVELDEAR